MNNIMNLDIKEPEITINGVKLTTAQACTIRVALTDFHMTLKHQGLGDDLHGKTMTKLYTQRIHELYKIIRGNIDGLL